MYCILCFMYTDPKQLVLSELSAKYLREEVLPNKNYLL